ncbi:flavodoxin [compost metagenome]
MKKALIYFSLEGNMEYIANEIAKGMDIDVIRLVPEKNYPNGKVSKFFWGGKSVMFGEKPKLVNKHINFDEYDTVLLGTPIWASTFTPPLNTLFSEYTIKDKKIALVATHGGGGADKCFEKMKELLDGNNFVGEFQFNDPLKNRNDDVISKIEKIKEVLK